MDDSRVSSYGGVAGRVLRESTSIFSITAAIAVGAMTIGLSFLAGLLGAPKLLMFLIQLLLAVVLAKTARATAAGDFGGALLSERGGGWSDALPTAGRYVALSFAWLVPLFLFGGDFLNPASLRAPTAPLFAFLFISLATPPVFLIVALTADEIAEVFMPRHWATAFRGRAEDLVVVFAVYLGGLTVSAFLAIVPAILLLARSPGSGVMMLAIAGAFVLGLAVLLLGRLCGSFVLTHGQEMEWMAPPPRREPPLLATMVSPPGRSAPPARVPPPLAPPVLASAATVAIPLAAVAPAAAPPIVGPKRMLLDLPERLEEAWRRFAADPRSGIALVEEMRASAMSASPQLLHALLLMRHQSGDDDGALALAPEALSVILSKGNVRLAAEVYRVLQRHVDALGFDREQLLSIAISLFEMDDWKTAANAFAHVLRRDASEVRAIKGMMQVADAMLRRTETVADARRLYDYLLESCPNSPLRELMREGQDKASRATAHA